MFSPILTELLGNEKSIHVRDLRSHTNESDMDHKTEQIDRVLLTQIESKADCVFLF